MKIFINRILDKQIYFSTDYGEGRGIWKEDTRPFQKEYFVEFDISKLYSYKELIISKTEEYKIGIYDNKINLTLLLTGYDEYGCATFQFGNSIIEIETNYDNQILALIGKYIVILVENLDIYDENL